MVYDPSGRYFVTEGADGTQDIGRPNSGQFARGVSGNPAGRPRGSRSESARALEAKLQEQQDALTQAAIDKALAGDVAALRLCLGRLAPARRDAPLNFEMPPVRNIADVMNASAALVTALGAGEVTPEEAQRVMALLKEHKALVEPGIHVQHVGTISLDAYLTRFPGGDHECDAAYVTLKREKEEALAARLRVLYSEEGEDDDYDEGEDDGD